MGAGEAVAPLYGAAGGTHGLHKVALPARLATAMPALATRRRPVRTATGGRYIDQVRAPLARSDVPGCVPLLSLAAYRQAARVEAGHVLVWAQALTVVKVFSDGVFPPVGGRAVTVTDVANWGPASSMRSRLATPVPLRPRSSCISATPLEAGRDRALAHPRRRA